MSLQWLSLLGCIWLQSINGTNSNFPAYSSQLKHLLHISQLQLNNLAFASDAGKLFGWFAGFAAIHLPLWVVLMIGSLLGFIGYGVQYLFLINQLTLSYGHVLLLTALAGNSICWINTVSYIVTIQNFPLDRQLAVGLSTSYQGLSAKIYTAIVDALFLSSPMEKAKAYLLLNSISPLIVCGVTSPVVKNMKVGKSKKIEAGFIVMFVITIATGTFAVVSSLDSGSSGLSPLRVVIVLALFLVAPVVIQVAEQFMERLQKKCLIRREGRVCDYNIEEVDSVERVENGVKLDEEGNLGSKNREAHDQGSVMEEIGVKVMLKRVEFWLYFFVYLFGATLGLVFLNNLGQIAESRGYSKTSYLVSLSSSFGFFGRLIPSLVDYFLSRSKYMISRPASIAAMMAPMSGAFFLLLSRTNMSLYLGTAIIGICTGAITSLSISTTTELFGIQNFSVNHNIVVANIPIGSFLFGDLAALLYRKESHERDGRCMGVECYQTTFIIWGSLCFLGTLLALVLHARTKKFYSHRF
ncbi:protein NUCLEAR FUSION DEFECTIVE 4 [Cornus florida]|uniref:protein NUCLEAR FUSION DEFECTIVE 4 n=1 Tax=Cornus florida TaxID=4283 RepID=UPI00289C6EA3|nr:protein NUCLEAR FUSION DEFECTIVE 4 [Cornus florida]